MVIHRIEDLNQVDCKEKIIILEGPISKDAFMPKDYPFYYPKEHELVITALEKSGAKAIVAVTKAQALSGMNPFPLFEDGNFLIPSAYMDYKLWQEIEGEIRKGIPTDLVINSYARKSASKQLVIHREHGAKDKIVVCAHMDTKYDTPGALDNGTGIAVLMGLMVDLNELVLDFSIDFVPFNSEEYFGGDGELAYEKYCQDKGETIKLVINIDAVGHLNSKVGISSYNLEDEFEEKIKTSIFKNSDYVLRGQPWYAGNHGIYAMNGIPCLAITSSDLFEGGLANTHTLKDTLETVNPFLIKQCIIFLTDLIRGLNGPLDKK